ncbi:hypothetical protein ACFL6A_00290 [bacterium]
MKDIRETAEKYSHAELEACIEKQIREGSNSCFTGENPEETMAVLSKASYVKKQVEEGKADTILDAVRQMAASIRSLGKNAP